MIYAYAVIDSKARFSERINGMEGNPVYSIPYRDIGLAVSDVDDGIRDAKQEHVLKHEEVVERLMEKFTVLPMRFLTVFKNRDNVLSMMKEYYEDFSENLVRLKGKVEFGIKVIWRGDKIRDKLVRAYGKGKLKAQISGDSRAKRYMMDKFKEYRIDREFEREGDEYISLVDKFFNNLAAGKKLEKLQSSNLLLNAYYLVRKKKGRDFKQAFERLRSSRTDLKCMLSGPWPPYNFVELKKRGLGHG